MYTRIKRQLSQVAQELSGSMSVARAYAPRIVLAGSVVVAAGIVAFAIYTQRQHVLKARTAATIQAAASGVSPARQMTVSGANGTWEATFTYGAQTVKMNGPKRIFAEPSTTSATVTTSTWVRLYPVPFEGTIDRSWLNQAMSDNQTDAKPDILETAMQYIAGAPVKKDASGLEIAGDASYGPLLANGSRQEGSDFNDFIGIKQNYASGVDKPELAQKGSLDCSGFQRMVWGYRNGLSLEGSQLDSTGKAIPRRAFQILYGAPGIVLAPDTGKQIINLSQLQAGDIVFHDASTNDGTQIDHLGIFLGVDSQGHYRFISSRKTANGPTMGDVGGKSILDGTGLYAASFRAIRRF